MFNDENSFDKLLNTVLGANSNQSKSASVALTPTPAQSVAQANQVGDLSDINNAVSFAASNLTPQEFELAETLGRMEAANTVKQANFIEDHIGGSLMNTNNPFYQLALANQTKQAGVAEDLKTIENLGKPTPKKPVATMQEIIDLNPNLRKPGNLAKVRSYLGAGVNSGMAVAKAHPKTTAAIAAGALAAGVGAKALLTPRQKMEMSLGKKVMNHVARHGVAYGAGAAALGGLGYLASQKSASAEEVQFDLMNKAASSASAFIGALAENVENSALTSEIQLYRAAVYQTRNGINQ